MSANRGDQVLAMVTPGGWGNPRRNARWILLRVLLMVVHSLCKLIVIALAMLLQMLLLLHLPFLTLTLILIPILMLIVGCNCHWSKTPITGHLKSIAALQIGRHAMQIEMPSQQ